MKIADLQERKLTDLKDLARDLNLKGVSTLRKQDLIYRILEHRAKSMAEGKPAQPRRIESSIKSDNSPSKPPPPAIKAESPVRPARTNQRPSTVPSKEPKLPLREPNQSKPTRHKGRELRSFGAGDGTRERGSGRRLPAPPGRGDRSRTRRDGRQISRDDRRKRVYDSRPEYMVQHDPSKTELDGMIQKVGVLEILPDGYGFLRSPVLC